MVFIHRFNGLVGRALVFQPVGRGGESRHNQGRFSGNYFSQAGKVISDYGGGGE